MSSRIMVALRIAAPRERVFDAFVREIHLWWRPQPLFGFTRRAGGRLAIEPWLDGRFTESWPDGEIFEIGRVTHWEPAVRLGLSWRQASFTADQSTQVMVDFETAGAETRVTVEHHGWDSVPIESEARHRMPDALFLQRHGEWWQQLLAALRRQVVGESA